MDTLFGLPVSLANILRDAFHARRIRENSRRRLRKSGDDAAQNRSADRFEQRLSQLREKLTPSDKKALAKLSEEWKRKERRIERNLAEVQDDLDLIRWISESP